MPRKRATQTFRLLSKLPHLANFLQITYDWIITIVIQNQTKVEDERISRKLLESAIKCQSQKIWCL